MCVTNDDKNIYHMLILGQTCTLLCFELENITQETTLYVGPIITVNGWHCSRLASRLLDLSRDNGYAPCWLTLYVGNNNSSGLVTLAVTHK